MTFRCPICRKEVPAGEVNSPFCSDRCRIIDLGNWASEKYVIPGNQRTDFEGQDDAEGYEPNGLGPEGYERDR